jgi:hypothetical protein
MLCILFILFNDNLLLNLTGYSKSKVCYYWRIDQYRFKSFYHSFGTNLSIKWKS